MVAASSEMPDTLLAVTSSRQATHFQFHETLQNQNVKKGAGPILLGPRRPYETLRVEESE